MATEILEVQLKVTGKDQYQSDLKKAQGTFGESMKGVMGVAAKVAAGVAAVGTAAVAMATKMTFTAARTETLGVAMEEVAKATKTSMSELYAQEKSLKKLGIATQEARTILTRFMQSNLDVADAAKVARTAQDMAVIAGQNSSETAEILTQAIATQSAELLRAYGITKTSIQIFEEYAYTLGKDAKELTNLEKKQAFLNIILAEGTKVAGVYEASMETAGKKIGSLDRHTQEASNSIGALFLPVLGRGVDLVTEFLKAIPPTVEAFKEGWNQVSEETEGVNEEFNIMRDRIQRLRGESEIVTTDIAEQWGIALHELKIAFEELSLGAQLAFEEFKLGFEEAGGHTSQLSENIDAHLNEAIRRFQEEMGVASVGTINWAENLGILARTVRDVLVGAIKIALSFILTLITQIKVAYTNLFAFVKGEGKAWETTTKNIKTAIEWIKSLIGWVNKIPTVKAITFTTKVVGDTFDSIKRKLGGGANGGIFAGKYATGGLIPGMSLSGDRVLAGVNSGEMIINKSQQSALFGFIKNLSSQPRVNNYNISGNNFGGSNRSPMQQENNFVNLLTSM